jgi:hypothetical protein
MTVRILAVPLASIACQDTANKNVIVKNGVTAAGIVLFTAESSPRMFFKIFHENAERRVAFGEYT